MLIYACMLPVIFYLTGLSIVSISQTDFAENEDVGQLTVSVFRQGSSTGILAFTLTSLTYDEFFSRGFPLDDEHERKSLPDPAESKKDIGNMCNNYKQVCFTLSRAMNGGVVRSHSKLGMQSWGWSLCSLQLHIIGRTQYCADMIYYHCSTARLWVVASERPTISGAWTS